MSGLAKNLAAAVARTDQRFDQSEAKAIRDLIPLARTYGVLQATDAVIQYAPPDTDGALIRSAR